MAQSDASLTTVAELRRKSYEISGQSSDGLLAVMAKGLDSMTRILSPSPNRHDIRRALITFDFERRVSMQSEAPNVDFVREVAYDVMEALHLTLLKVNERIEQLESYNGRNILQSISEQCTQTDQIKEELDASLTDGLTPNGQQSPKGKGIVEDRISTQTMDDMSMIPDYTVPSLVRPKKEEVKYENGVDEDNISTHNRPLDGVSMIPKFTVGALVKPKKEEVKSEDRTDEDNISTHNQPLGGVSMIPKLTVPSLLTPKKEVKNEEGIAQDHISTETAEAVSTTPNSPSLLTPKEDEADVSQSVPYDDQMASLDFMGDGMSINEEDLADFVMTGEGNASLAAGNSLNQQPLNNQDATLQAEDSSKTVASEEKRRLTRSAARRVPYAQSEEDSDDHDAKEPPKKRGKSSDKGASHNQPKSWKRYNRVSKQSDKEMKCIECEFRTRSAAGFVLHLKTTHSTSPVLAGIALLCECGEESISGHHSQVCKISNFTVIRKGNEPIRRFEDAIEKTTPQCVLCEVYPKTPSGYYQHLRLHHNSTPRENGIFIRCACGEAGFTMHSNPEHNKQKCDGSKFTLHQLKEK